jgi:hypothetical protein
MESTMGGMSAKCKESKEKNPRESPYGRELTVAIAVQTPEDAAETKGLNVRPA